MLMAIRSNDFSKEFARTLAKYTKEVEQGLEKVEKKVAKETVDDLKATSPKLYGDYSKGWKAKKVESSYIIHNATDYQLTHLLENSHALRDGGRSTPQPHIGPAEERAVEKFVSETERMIRG